MKAYIGIDNGVTGSVAWILGDGTWEVRKIPVRSEQSYTKKKQNITRVMWDALFLMFEEIVKAVNDNPDTTGMMSVIERPMVNPERFKATVSALRCLESVLIAVEAVEFPYQYIDSKQWQREMLPAGAKGSPELKRLSKEIGARMFPGAEKCAPDCDSILMAEWARRARL